MCYDNYIRYANVLWQLYASFSPKLGLLGTVPWCVVCISVCVHTFAFMNVNVFVRVCVLGVEDGVAGLYVSFCVSVCLCLCTGTFWNVIYHVIEDWNVIFYVNEW